MKTNFKRTVLSTGILLSSVIVTACGGGGGGSGGDSDNTPQNNAPEISGKANIFVQANMPYLFQPQASDADGDALTFSVENLPAWANFDPYTGELTGNPAELDIGEYPDITISVSDGMTSSALKAFSIEVLDAPLGRRNIGVDNAMVTPTDNGFQAQGRVEIMAGNDATVLDESDLQFEFDAGDNLVNVTGTALLPSEISNFLLIENPLTVKVGLYTGAQINEDENIGLESPGGIRLIDDRYYLVFFVGADLGITFQDKSNPDRVPITLGIGEAQNMIIWDPTDQFSYNFGYLNGVGKGKGKSDHGLIPYEPYFVDGPDAFTKLDSFYGHKVERRVFPIGYKVFDLFSLSGTMVVRNPEFEEVNWGDPLNSNLYYQAGFNGEADFEFGILGVGLFEYHLTDASATFDVGLLRQEFAMQGVYQPTETSQPVWLPVRPSLEPTDKVVTNMFVDGKGGFELQLRGQFESTWPEANLYGTMTQTADELLMTGHINDDVNPINVSARTNGSAFEAKVDYAVDINADLQAKVLAEMDSKIAEVQATVEEYTNAYANYEIAISLDGLRAQLPGLADTAITELNKVPGTVYTSVYNSVYNYIINGQYCRSFAVTICFDYKDYVNASATAINAATDARRQAQTAIASYITTLQNLKTYANAADDDTFRALLKSALLEIYNNQTINRTVSYNYKKTISGSYAGISWSKKIDKTFSYTINQRVVTVAQADMIKAAADNVDVLDASYQVVINLQDIIDTLPVEEAIDQAKKDVQAGLKQVPVFEGAGYTVSEDGRRTGYIILNGQKEEIQFNPLDPKSVAANILEYITNTLIDTI